MGIIKKPLLPPIKGYVEVEVDGERKYKNIETEEITSTPNQEKNDDLIISLMELIVEQEYRIIELEERYAIQGSENAD